MQLVQCHILTWWHSTLRFPLWFWHPTWAPSHILAAPLLIQVSVYGWPGEAVEEHGPSRRLWDPVSCGDPEALGSQLGGYLGSESLSVALSTLIFL